MHPTLDELEKLGAISSEQAESAYERLQQLDQSKPSAGQALRYGALGAIGAPIASATGDVIRGQKPFKAVEHEGKPIRGGRARGALGAAAAGAITGGVFPFMRYHLDRAAEMRTLHQFMKEYEEGQQPKQAADKTKEKDSDAMDLNYSPGDFSVNPYSGGMGAGPILLASLLSGSEPSLEAPVKRKKEAASLMPAVPASPKSGLTAARKVGQPKLTAPSGPSIADVAKPRGFGLPLPGALKGTV